RRSRRGETSSDHHLLTRSFPTSSCKIRAKRGREAMSVTWSVLQLKRGRGTHAQRLMHCCLLAVSVVCVAVIFPRPAAGAVESSAAHPVVLAVWALPDGGDPVSRAVVRVY